MSLPAPVHPVMEEELLRERLETLLDQADDLTYGSFPTSKYGYPTSLTPAWYAWSQRVENLITEHFKRDSAPVQLVERGSNAEPQIVGNEKEKFESAKSLFEGSIQEALNAVENDSFAELKRVSRSRPESESIDPEKIFVVHGHDHAAKSEMEIFLREVGLDPVVLHREADEGQTIIEKFEMHSSTGYAIVLLTPDDEVVVSRDTDGVVDKTKKHARPNVVFELGYFVGQLGRNRVCCVAQSQVSLPSDISGLIYKQFSNSIEEVKYALIKELRKANYRAEL